MEFWPPLEAGNNTRHSNSESTSELWNWLWNLELVNLWSISSRFNMASEERTFRPFFEKKNNAIQKKLHRNDPKRIIYSRKNLQYLIWQRKKTRTSAKTSDLKCCCVGNKTHLGDNLTLFISVKMEPQRTKEGKLLPAEKNTLFSLVGIMFTRERGGSAADCAWQLWTLFPDVQRSWSSSFQLFSCGSL